MQEHERKGVVRGAIVEVLENKGSGMAVGRERRTEVDSRQFKVEN
jgi:hypothetical protein